MSPGRLRAELDSLRRACERHGRNPHELRIACTVPAPIADDVTASALIDSLQEYAALGVTHLQIRLSSPSEQGLLEGLCRWGDDVLPHLAQTRPSPNSSSNC